MDARAPTRLLKVLYDFTAEDDTELTVAAGQVVRARAFQDEKDGWLLVETVSAPFTKGYVPQDYVTKAETTSRNSRSRSPSKARSVRDEEDNVSSYRDLPTPTHNQHNEGTSSDYGGGGGFASPVQSRQRPRSTSSMRSPGFRLNSTRSHSSGRDIGLGANNPTPRSPRLSLGSQSQLARPTSSSSATAYVADTAHYFARHDAWFQKLTYHQREEHEKLERAAGGVEERIRVASARAADVLGGMLQLEERIEGERRKWVEHGTEGESGAATMAN